MRQTRDDMVPKVSVCVIAYKQEEYIAQCLQSLVEQKTDFPFEVIVGDDCSPDRTAEIIKDFANRYPDLITAVLHSSNRGATENYFSVHALARGAYVAHLDGDDLALPGKLQAQADFLDEHPEVNIAWHRMYVQRGNERFADNFDYKKQPVGGFRKDDIHRLIAIGMHSSKMYRASVGAVCEPSFPALDYYVNIEQIGRGAACFVSDVPYGVYRAGVGVASAPGGKTKRLLAQTMHYFLKKDPGIRRAICTSSLVFLLAAIKNRRFAEVPIFLPVFLKSIDLAGVFDVAHCWASIRMLRLPG